VAALQQRDARLPSSAIRGFDFDGEGDAIPTTPCSGPRARATGWSRCRSNIRSGSGSPSSAAHGHRVDLHSPGAYPGRRRRRATPTRSGPARGRAADERPPTRRHPRPGRDPRRRRPGRGDGGVSVAFHPAQLRLLPGWSRASSGSPAPASCSASHQPARACQGANLRRRRGADQPALVDELARRGIVIAAVEVCMHHPTGGPAACRSSSAPATAASRAPGCSSPWCRRLGLDPAGATWSATPRTTCAPRAPRPARRPGLLARRCELCPQRAGPTERPDFLGAHLDEVAAAIVAASRG
jgi:hypothetical protein